MTDDEGPREELIRLTARYRHLREEHRRAAGGGSARRGLEHDLRDAGAHADRRITALVADPDDRAAWTAHLHHGDPPPDRPEAAPETVREPAPDRPAGRRPWPR